MPPLTELIERNVKLVAEVEYLRALLQELIDIEGPQPGTADWAAKVREALTGSPGLGFLEARK
jgi:hypothetical protein